MRERRRDGDDPLNDSVELRDDVMLRDAQHVPAERVQRAVTRGIMMRATVMRAAVDLHDQAHLGCKRSPRCGCR